LSYPQQPPPSPGEPSEPDGHHAPYGTPGQPGFAPPGRPDSPYGQPPFAAVPGDPDGQPAYPGVSPLPRTSRLAITGLILAVFLPLIGLVLSIVAFFRTGPGKLRGRGLAVAGMITAVVVGAGATVTTVVVLADHTHPTDPGCTALQHPDVKLAPDTAGPDFQYFIDIFNHAADKAQRGDVRNALRTIANDYKFLQDSVSSGVPAAGQMPNFEADLKRVQSVCTLPTTIRVP
jgi:hypothetical protein